MNPSPPSVDGIAPASPSPPMEKQVGKETLSRARFAIVTLFGLPYVLYMLWSFFLLAVLPDAEGTWEVLIPFAKLLATIVGFAMAGVGAVAVMRIGQSATTDDRIKYGGFIRIGVVITPAILMSLFVPYWIQKEPPLALQILSPDATVQLIAPLSMTFDASDAVAILQRQDLDTKTFSWDFNGDGQFDLESVTPDATAYFDRQGGYNVSVTLQLSDGSKRTVFRRVVIPQAVFSYTPFIPVVDEEIRFSVAHLIPDAEGFVVRDVQWDFNQDGIPDETSSELETVHTFLKTGPQQVSVTITFTNQTQNTYVRVLDIQPPRPNPFPVTIDTNPDFLESPPPFQVVFHVSSDTALQDVTWNFDDGSPEEKGDRVGHTFKNRRIYQVRASARDHNGQISKVTKVVKVVENLQIPDLSFDGSHPVQSDTITAEAPVSVSLTPRTAVPLIDFWWESPLKASQIESTDTTLKAIFREEGTYALVLLAKDAEGRVMRKTIRLVVQPKSDHISFQVRPTQIVAPQVVKFDASQSQIPGEQITGFVWSFGDTDPEEQKFGDAYEEHEYTEPGEYVVTLTVNTLSGRTETTTQTLVVRAPFLKSCFTLSRNRIKAMQGILFSWECSTGAPSKVIWRYGDGAEAESDPKGRSKEIDHLFEKPGVYTVELYLEDENGSTSTFEQQVTVESP